MGTAVAALQAPVNGQVYDDALGIYWLQDANFVKISCDANSALWQSFDPEAIVNNSGRTKVQICNDNGRLNWHEAEAWIAHLNVNNHVGHDDWRQPATGPVDGNAFDMATRTVLAPSPAPGTSGLCAPDKTLVRPPTRFP